LGAASGNALKSAITDALKRAARHFGEKLGNALYHDNFSINNAPVNLKDAFESLDVQRAKTRFGFDKDRVNTAVQNQNTSQPQNTANQYQNRQQTNANAPVKQETRQVPNASTTSSTSQQQKPLPTSSYTTQRTTTQMNATPVTNSSHTAQNTYATNNHLASQPKANVTTAPSVMPHHGVNSMGAAARKSIESTNL
jgi:DNA repair and recombination protein RAD52